MSSFINLIIITGVILITIRLTIDMNKCPEPKIEYRFVPRTFKEQQESPVKVSDIFSTMFERPTPFIQRAIGNETTKSNINRFFISQG